MSNLLNFQKSLCRYLIDFSCREMSKGIGASFPTDYSIGDIFFRSDQVKLYQLTMDDPSDVWTELPIDYFYIDFDAHAQIHEYPEHDIIGLRAFQIVIDEHIFYVSGMFGVGIFNDTNLQRHYRILDKLYAELLPTRRLPVYDMNSGLMIGEFIILDGTELMPMFKADNRPIQFIGFSFSSDLTASLNNP